MVQSWDPCIGWPESRGSIRWTSLEIALLDDIGGAVVTCGLLCPIHLSPRELLARVLFATRVRYEKFTSRAFRYFITRALRGELVVFAIVVRSTVDYNFPCRAANGSTLTRLLWASMWRQGLAC